MKRNPQIGPWLPFLLACLIAGCTKYPKDAGFSDVREQVQQRTGMQVQWNQDTAADRQVAQRVRAMLQKELTADAAVQIALLNNQNLQAVYEDLGIAQAELVEAGLLKNPTLSASVGIPRYAALPYQIDVTQDFLDLLVMPMRKRIAAAQFEAAKLKVTDAVVTTASQVKVAFYHAQAAAQVAELQRERAAVADAALETAQKLHDAGNLTDLKLASERAVNGQAHLGLAKADREARDARDELSGLMGIWGADLNWKMAAHLPDLPLKETDLSRTESLALSRRPDLAAARQEVLAQANSMQLTHSTALLAEAKAGIDIVQDVDGPFYLGPTIQIPLPIFNHGQPAIAAAVSRFRQSLRKYFALAVDVVTQVRRARNRLLADREMAEYDRKVVIPTRQQITKQEQLQFNAMQVDLFELLTAKQAEFDAGRDYVQALEDYWVDRSELERASGGNITASAAPTTQEHHP